VREHSALGYQTPFAHLKSQLPEIDDRIRFVIPIVLDEVSVRPKFYSSLVGPAMILYSCKASRNFMWCQ
jgi:hypothetical protein